MRESWLHYMSAYAMVYYRLYFIVLISVRDLLIFLMFCIFTDFFLLLFFLYFLLWFSQISFNSIIPELFRTFVPLERGEGWLPASHNSRLACDKNFIFGMEVASHNRSKLEIASCTKLPPSLKKKKILENNQKIPLYKIVNHMKN